MAQRPLSTPLNVIAFIFLDQEGLAASLVAVAVDALLDGEVHDGAGGDFGCYVISRFTLCRMNGRGEGTATA